MNDNRPRLVDVARIGPPAEPTAPLQETTADSYVAPRAIRVVRRGDESTLDMTIYPDTDYTFGRDRSCTVVISDTTVSRDHGLLTCRTDGSWVYRDKGSSNGSF